MQALRGARDRAAAHARYRINQTLRRRGLTVAPIQDAYERARALGDEVGTVDFPPHWNAILGQVRDYTLVSDQRMAGLLAAVEYVAAAKIPGAFVECGVWRGGSSMAAALAMLRLGESRELVLFDTFEGMPEPGEHDVDFAGEAAVDGWAPGVKESGTSPADVAAAMNSTGYDMARVRLVQGLVEDTIPAEAPDPIAVLRLDTDWYESTRHELEHLFPRLSPGGVLIIDDYGHFKGARRAVDEYFVSTPILLARLDYTGRMAVKR